MPLERILTGFVDSKLRSGEESTKALALLSYRMSFYVVNNALAEELVSKHFQYVLYANGARDLLRTIQASEPILAHGAAKEMASWNTRLNIVQQFLYSGLEGSINIGDLGEMVVAMVLLFAYDKAMHECVKYLDPAAVTLERFTKLLLGEPVKDAISESMSTDQDMGTIWNTGLVFF